MLRRWLSPITVLILALPAQAATLQISVAGIRNQSGTIYICVFGTGAGFPGCERDPSALRQTAPASADVMRFDFDVTPGRHAISVLHDENNNHKLDTNALGIPLEGVGVSNNPQPRWGAPRFADSVFMVGNAGAAITVTMVYP